MAHEQETHTKGHFVLPPSVAGPADVNRLQRDADELDEYLRQAAIRKSGEGMKLPNIPVMLDDISTANHLNLLHETDRQLLSGFLKNVQLKSPVVHVSFAAEPSTTFTAKIVQWMRQNIHPLLLVQVGLQPSIAAGCTVRTTNKVFDFSLRQHLTRNRQLLVDAIDKIGQGAAATPAPEPPKMAEVGVAPDPQAPGSRQ
jgi:F0F1-type ATP synthase delta subunit